MPSIEQYRDRLHSLIPPGRLWSDDPTSILARLLGGFSAEFERLESRAGDLLLEADPRSTTDLLAQWEAVAGLPDPCHGLGITLEARRAELTAKITLQGSMSRQFYIDVAASLGFVVVSLDEFSPSNPGPGGLGFSGTDWWFVWRLNIDDTGGISYFTCTSGCDEPLATWGDDVIECVIDRIKPAHTRVLFAYV